MIKKVRKSNSTISLTHSKDNELSIQFNLDGFSFCIKNHITKKDIYFCEYEFEASVNTPENLLLKIKEIFKKDTYLQKDFSKVTIIHQNNLSTLIPNAFFDEEKLSNYLDFNIKVLKTDFIAFDSLEELEAKNVYVPYININNYLFQNFGEFEYQHHTTVLLEKYINQSVSKEKVMYVNVCKSTIDIIVLEHKKILLSNSFSFTTQEDFLYYILFTAEQLDLDTKIFALYLTGEISLDMPIYKIAYKYIKNIYFLESNNFIFKDLDIPKHSNYILLGS